MMRKGDATSPALSEADRLANSVRELADAVALGSLDQTDLAVLRDDVDSLVSRVAATERLGWWEQQGSIGDRWRAMSPFSGSENPRSLGLRVERHDDAPDELTGTVTVPASLAGPPGAVHGGVIAGLLDEMVGALGQRLEGSGTTVTAALDVRYRRPTPLGRPLHLHARVLRASTRRLKASASCTADGVETATATALVLRRMNI